MRDADRAWVRRAALVGYQAALQAIADQPPASRSWAVAHWDDVVKPMIIDSIARQAVLALAQRDATAAREQGRLQ
jgi:hypothetical protein